MPIEIKEYTWHETDSSVFITLSLNGVYKYKMDLFYSPEYLKVSYPPYFFEAFLPAKIWTDLSLDDLKEMEGKKEDAIDTLGGDNGTKCLIEVLLRYSADANYAYVGDWPIIFQSETKVFLDTTPQIEYQSEN